ncbi:hypothetical protein H6F89_09005 [Cyanobacteria bacterium FACHB-63]|nr:hypothetical protein [Cyanobacteria bacterium FACHB-63]
MIVNKRLEHLLKFAYEEFGQLNPIEEKLFSAVASGQIADYRVETAEPSDSPDRQEEFEKPILQADRIVWLCTEKEVSSLIVPQGLHVRGARIEGTLNFEFGSIEIPLFFSQCVFTEPILLRQAKLRRLELVGTQVVSINAVLTKVEGSVVLKDEFQSNAGVILSGATIGGNLVCENSQFINPNGDALSVEGANITASVLLRNGFEANGKVNLYRASIGGNLDCQGGRFVSQGGECALSAEGAKIAGSVFLRKNPRSAQAESFYAEGLVRFFGAVIGGAFECDGGKFINPNGEALSAEGANINGPVLLRNGFEANGKVNFYGVAIGGNFSCQGGRFVGQRGEYALLAERAKIAGSVLLRKNPEDAQAESFYAEGLVRFFGAVIGGAFECDGGKFINSNGEALNVGGANITKSALLRNGFEANGKVIFYQVTIGGDLDCRKGKFSNPNGEALTLAAARIMGSMFLEDAFQAEGKVSLVNTTVDNTLVIRSINNSANTAFDLRFARIRTLEDDEKSWPRQNQLNLNQFVYETISYVSPLDYEKRLAWLSLQDLKTHFSPQPYEQLAKVLRLSGHEDAAVHVLIAKQEDRRRYGGLGRLGRFWNRFLGFTIAHGYRPHRALIFSLVIVCIGIAVFSYGASQGAIVPSKSEAYKPTVANQPQQLSETYPQFNPIIYSLDIFLPIINLRLKDYWQPAATQGSDITLLVFKSKIGSLIQIYFWLHIVLGWLLTTLWVAGFTGIVRRVS